MSKKTTRRAMLASVVALALCFTMLIGTTYAWFTDSVTSANNIIKSGTLKIAMNWADAKNDPANTAWTDASTGAIFNYDRWEPGYVDARHIQIKNNGTLALKYKLAIVANGDVSELADVIDVYFADPAVQVANRAALAGATRLGTLTEVLAGMGTTYGTNHLLAGEHVEVTLALKMQESAGNEYQNKSIGTNFSVVLLATQYNYEVDSFDKDYDKTAEYPVADQSQFAAALTAAAASNEPAIIALSAGNYTIPANTNIDGLKIEAKKGTTVDTINVSATAGSLKNFEAEGVTFVSSTDNAWTGILSQKTTLENATFKNCVFSSEGNSGRTNGVYGPYTTGTITFEDCTIYGDVYGINFSTIDTLVLKNCDISGWNTFGGSNTANVIIEGCRFHKSGYNKLGFYTNATITNCVFDTNFFDANTGDYGNFTGGIDARRNDQLPITITLSENTIKNVNTNETTPLAAANLLTANYTDTATSTVMHCNPTWILNGVDVTASVPLE